MMADTESDQQLLLDSPLSLSATPDIPLLTNEAPEAVSTLNWSSSSSSSEDEDESKRAENDQWTTSSTRPSSYSNRMNSFQLNEHLPFDSDDELFPISERPKTKNELDVTAIQDFTQLPFIQVPETMKMQPIGFIHAIVDACIVVQSDTRHVPLDLESLLATEDGTVLGKTYDTIGPVQSPAYCVLQTERVEAYFETHSAIGQRVFFVLEQSVHVDLPTLSRIKGSDASNIFDEEPSENELEYSDDELESVAKSQRHKRKSNPPPSLATRTLQQELVSKGPLSGPSYADYEPLKRPGLVVLPPPRPSSSTMEQTSIQSDYQEPSLGHTGDSDEKSSNSPSLSKVPSNPFAPLPMLHHLMMDSEGAMGKEANPKGLKRKAEHEKLNNLSELYYVE